MIANPAAGSGRGRARTETLVRTLEARGHAVERFSTRRAGDARRRVAEAEGAVACIVAAAWLSRHSYKHRTTSSFHFYVLLALSFFIVAVQGTWLGPFVLLPTSATITTSVFGCAST